MSVTQSRAYLFTNKAVQTSPKTPSQSRIIQKKQIQRRLQGLSLKQYEKIAKNLSKQNQKLKEEVTTLGQKNKKLQTQHKRNPQIQQQILKLKKQLQSKYQQMNQLKETIRKQTEKKNVQQISTNMKQKKNELKMVQMEIQSLAAQKSKLYDSLKDNQIDFQQYVPTKDLLVQIQSTKQENKTLKKQIYDISLSIKQKQRTAKDALTKIYTLKKQGQRSFDTTNRIKSLSVLGKKQHNRYMSQDLSDLKGLQQEIKLLKKKKQVVENQLSTDKVVKESARSKVQKKIRQLLQYHKQLFKRRVRGLTELNYLQKKQAQNKLKKQQQQIEKPAVPTVQKSIQTENIIKKQYRKDWIGDKQGLQFDDTQLLQYKELCLIKSLTVYRTTDHIVFIRFGYQCSNQKYKYQSRIPFDKDTLKKIQGKRVVSKSNGHLINLMISITKNIITRVQSTWSDGDSSVQGWDSQESDKFKLDILQKQRPIAFFGTVVPHPKGSFALESLGCQILESQE